MNFPKKKGNTSRFELVVFFKSSEFLNRCLVFEVYNSGFIALFRMLIAKLAVAPLNRDYGERSSPSPR
jgi:hypothetical protein